MFRTIIVDDEKWALIGIRKFLERGSSQFSIIHETTNPVDALNVLLREQPDIVFTDIRMPALSGIDLINKARAQGLKTEFVIISGFSEFSYAQQAIRAGALDYLLKPLDVPNARSILGKIEAQLSARQQVDDLILYGTLSNEHANAADMLKSRLDGTLLPCWQVATVFLQGHVMPPLELTLPGKHQLLQMQLGPRKVVCLVNSAAPMPEAITAAFEAMGTQIVSCGLSPAADNVEKLPHLLRLAEFAVFDSFVQPERKVFHFRAPQNTKVFEVWQRISRELQGKKAEGIKRIFSVLPEQFRQQGLTANDALALWNLIAENLSSYLPRTDALEDITPLRVYAMADQFGTMQAMCQYLASQLAPATDGRDGSAYQHFQMLLRHVDERYIDSLNLQELCDRFYINVSYCCELFRKETKQTFTQYITRLRMDHAKELLTSTTLPLKEICERIGYNDYFYFDKVFKKNVGCTPSEYRRRVEGGDA